MSANFDEIPSHQGLQYGVCFDKTNIEGFRRMTLISSFTTKDIVLNK